MALSPSNNLLLAPHCFLGGVSALPLLSIWDIFRSNFFCVLIPEKTLIFRYVPSKAGHFPNIPPSP